VGRLRSARWERFVGDPSLCNKNPFESLRWGIDSSVRAARGWDGRGRPWEKGGQYAGKGMICEQKRCRFCPISPRTMGLWGRKKLVKNPFRRPPAFRARWGPFTTGGGGTWGTDPREIQKGGGGGTLEAWKLAGIDQAKIHGRPRPSLFFRCFGGGRFVWGRGAGGIGGGRGKYWGRQASPRVSHPFPLVRPLWPPGGLGGGRFTIREGSAPGPSPK